MAKPNARPSSMAMVSKATRRRQHLSNGLVDAAYEGFDSNQIQQDVAAFLRTERLSPDSEIIYVQIVGSYNSKTESAADAITRAQNFSRKLDLVETGLFRNASTTLSSTTSIPINRIVVKFTFAVNFGVKSNP